MLCRLGNSKILNVEIQLYEEKDEAKRKIRRIFTTLIKLVKDNLLDPKDATKQINVIEEKFRKMMFEMSKA